MSLGGDFENQCFFKPECFLEPLLKISSPFDRPIDGYLNNVLRLGLFEQTVDFDPRETQLPGNLVLG